MFVNTRVPVPAAYGRSPIMLVCAALAMGTLSGCSDAEKKPVSRVTYHAEIRPLIESNCVECHKEGGIGPSALDNWETVDALKEAIVSAVSEARMPPWPADQDCREMAEVRALSEDARALFESWREDGFPEGDEDDYEAPEAKRRQELGEPTLTLLAEAEFTPEVNADTYHCFSIGSLEADTYVTALGIAPGVEAEVHHVQLHRVESADAAAVQAMDDEHEGAGYPCSSAGIGGGFRSQNMFSYRPGSLPVVLAQGDALYFRGGSGLVLQIHYNTQFLPAGSEPEPDRTRVLMWSLPHDSAPERVIYRTGVLSPLSGKGDGSVAQVILSSIPENEGDVIGESTLPMSRVSQIGAGLVGFGSGRPYLDGEVVGMTPHAHAWATQMTASLTRSDGSEECLVNVPDWDYGWQLDYLFVKGVPYEADDMLHVQCNFDNTADNQPVVNGSRVTPAPIVFGENTLNEMCLHYLWLRFPYAEFQAALP